MSNHSDYDDATPLTMPQRIMMRAGFLTPSQHEAWKQSMQAAGWKTGPKAAEEFRRHNGEALEGEILPPERALVDRRLHGPPDVVDPLTLREQAIPPRRWIVEDWLPVGYATLLYGEGGSGKSLLAHQLLTACATGSPWLGLPVHPCRTFALFCEDDTDEVHLRQDTINRRLGIGFEDLGDMRWSCPVGQDNFLIRFDRKSGEPVLTKRFLWLKETILKFGARVALIDTVATTFGGNENDRMQTTAFVGQTLTKLAQEIDGAVIACAHPSKSSAYNGNGDSGSTGWVGSSRAAWSFAYPDVEVGNRMVPDKKSNDRILTRLKVNGAARGAQITARWDDWFFDVPARQTGPEALAAVSATVTREAECEAKFLELLDKCNASNVHLSVTANSPNYAPKHFALHPDRGGFSKKDFIAALHRLMGKAIWNGGKVRVNGVLRDKLERLPAAE